MRILFVGPFSGFTSYPVVCKGLVHALAAAGFELDVADTTWDGSPDHTAPGLVDDDKSIRFLDRKEVVELVQKGEHKGGDGGICVAVNPSHHMMGIKEKGYKLAGMFVGDVDTIPGPWQELMKRQDVILTPSYWGKQVIKKAGITQSVIVCNHGVSPVFKPDLSVELADNPVIFFHPCSAIYYPERKGTPQLLEAFSRLADARDDVRLRLFLGGKTKPVQKMLRSLERCVLDKMEIYFREGAREPAEMCYDYQISHVGVYPSRAEGMGMCVAHDTNITTKEGVLPVQDVVVGTEVLTEDGQWNIVKATQKHKKKRLIRIECQGIPELALTPEHPVLVASRGKDEPMPSFRKTAADSVCWMQAKDIDESCYLVLRGPVCSGLPGQEIDLVGFSKRDGKEVYEKDDVFSLKMSNDPNSSLTAKVVAKCLGVTEHVFRRAVQPSNKARTERTEKARSFIREKARELGYFDQRIWLPKKLPWTEDFCRLVGYYAAEGSVSKKNGEPRFVQFAFSQDTDSIPVSQVTGYLESIGLNGNIYDKKTNRGRNVTCSSSVLASLLKSMCGGNAHQKKLPSVTWSLPADLRASLLEALIRGDGCEDDGVLEFSSVSSVLAFQVRDLWLSLGVAASIKSSPIPQRRKNSLSRVICHGEVRKSSNVSWKVRVAGSFFEKACSLIGISPSPRKTKTERRGTGFVQYDEAWLAPVRSVREGRTSKHVYDLQVEENETFVANGVVVHNCPIEQRACGVPVIQTMCTGHADHLNGSLKHRDWGIEAVHHGEMTEAWGSFGKAPMVQPDWVYDAMLNFLTLRETLTEAAKSKADAVRAGWSWEETTRPLVDWIKSAQS